MKQVVQPLSGGPVEVLDVPRPSIGPTEVLVEVRASVISPGTERALTTLAQGGLMAKARARPDLVRQVVHKARANGVGATLRTVRRRLGSDLPLGYSAAGMVVEVGSHVAGIVPGQRVATGGAGKANHAEFQAVPALLCAVVPDGVPTADAAFATIASVALHGLRLAEVGPGSKVVVVGLGLVGQLSLRLARAAGCDVAGIDLAVPPVERARASGALGLVEAGDDTTAAVADWSRGRGADAVLLTASGPSSAPMRRVPSLCRDRANVVVVGDVGLEVDRAPLYEKELTVRVARSYGPGRYERAYEDWAVDLPAGHVRWTEGRNLEAVLDLLSSGRLVVADLVTQRFPVEEAPKAYELIGSGRELCLAVQLSYPGPGPGDTSAVVVRRPAPAAREPGVGLVGAGAFASGVLLPALRAAGFSRLVSVASASGLSAARLAERGGFEKAVSGAQAVIDDPEVSVVVVATPHDSHAELAARALRQGKHVFCEKPLALSMEELEDVEAAWREGGGVLLVGFNRRWSTAVRIVRQHLGHGSGPLVITYRVSAGQLPGRHWYHDRRQGGRLAGEVCHFVDTCNAIAGEGPTSVHAVGSGPGESALAQDVAVSMGYADGSVAAVTYASGGHPSTEKERIEVLGRGRSAAVVDFRRVVLDGRAVGTKLDDKGHRAILAAFRRLVDHADPEPTQAAITSSRAVLRAVASLGAQG